MIDSKYMKACLSAYFRFKRATSCIATEVGYFNSDFIAVGRSGFLEIEIKVSKADLNNDFKKRKHQVYESDKNNPWTPQQFYFAVPEELVDYALSKCVDKPYGVLAIREVDKGSNRSWMDRVRVVKRAKKIHNNPIQEKVKYIIYSRLASEMTNLRIALCN